MLALAIIAVVVITIDAPPDRQSDAIARVIELAAPTIAALLAILKVQDLHDDIKNP